MSRAARAIIIEDDKMLLMHRNKQGSKYFTLVGGQVKEDETLEQGLAREVSEETGLVITKSKLVFIEEHPSPYNEQYIFLCEVAPHAEAQIQDASEEGFMNLIGIDVHTPAWAYLRAFHEITFRTPQLHEAINHALKSGFPESPVKL
jgi:ADP-ribose pyrophosphatase YjhB (NUDIX family)